MKKLEEYTEDIYKCTKCGLCQAVCPLYELLGKETAVSRGKFALLNGILQNEIKITPKIREAMDLCLSCKACDDFCPSGISAEEIILAARAKCSETIGIPIIKQLINQTLANNYILRTLAIFLYIYKFLKLNIITEKLPSSSKIGNLFSTLNSFLYEEIKYEKSKTIIAKKDTKIMYFPGCVNNFFNKSVYNSLKIILETNGYELIKTPDFSCCGMTARNVGDLKTYNKLAKKNLNKINNDIDYLVVDCASCYTALLDYEKLTDEKLKQKAEKIKTKIIHINELLLKLDINFETNNTEQNLNVTYHEPCHLKRHKNLTKYSKNIINKIQNVTLTEMEETQKCCGMAGTFIICNSSISKEITNIKINNIKNTNSSIILTDCSGCKIGLIKGTNKLNIPVIQPIELIAKFYKDKKY
ncbi:MAG: (Fe-S)-binding protein [bacterium]